MADKNKDKKSESNFKKPTQKTVVRFLIGCAFLLAILVLAMMLFKVVRYLLTDNNPPAVAKGQLESLTEQMAEDGQIDKSQSTADKLKSNKGIVSASVGDTKSTLLTKKPTISTNKVVADRTNDKPSNKLNNKLNNTSNNKSNNKSNSKPSSKSNYRAQVTPKKPRPARVNSTSNKTSSTTANTTRQNIARHNATINASETSQQQAQIQVVEIDPRNINPAGPRYATLTPSTDKKITTSDTQTPVFKAQVKANIRQSVQDSFNARVRFQDQLLANTADTTAIFECTSEKADNAILNVQNTHSGYTLKLYRTDNNNNISLLTQQPTQDAYFMEHVNGYEVLMKQRDYWYQFIQFATPKEGIDATFSQYSVKSSKLIDRFYCVEESMVRFDQMLPQEFNFMPIDDDMIQIMQSFQ